MNSPHARARHLRGRASLTPALPPAATPSPRQERLTEALQEKTADTDAASQLLSTDELSVVVESIDTKPAVEEKNEEKVRPYTRVACA